MVFHEEGRAININDDTIDKCISQLLLRSLTDEERILVRDAVYGDYDDNELVVRYHSIETDFNVTVQRASMRRLKPGVWLNDELVNLYMSLLAKRDMSQSKRCHFFKSFFMTKLLDEGATNKYT